MQKYVHDWNPYQNWGGANQGVYLKGEYGKGHSKVAEISATCGPYRESTVKVHSVLTISLYWIPKDNGDWPEDKCRNICVFSNAGL